MYDAIININSFRTSYPHIKLPSPIIVFVQVTCFPLLGVADFIVDPQPFSAPHSKSDFIPDYIINPHPRFAALTTNIRSRRGQKVDIQVPLFKDLHTPEFANQTAQKEDGAMAPLPEGYKLEPDTNIHMDAMGFGMGMCCLVRNTTHLSLSHFVRVDSLFCHSRIVFLLTPSNTCVLLTQ